MLSPLIHGALMQICNGSQFLNKIKIRQNYLSYQTVLFIYMETSRPCLGLRLAIFAPLDYARSHLSSLKVFHVNALKDPFRRKLVYACNRAVSTPTERTREFLIQVQGEIRG